MSRGKSGGRHVTPGEAALWSRATHSLHRVKGKPRVTAHAAETAPAPIRSAGVDAGRPKTRLPEPPRAVSPPSAAASRGAAPLAQFDRRALRQVATGKVAIDGRLDLHGLQRGDAYARLRAFLLESQAQGRRMLLVITGKGGAVETADHLARSLGRPERGILQRSVPQWLGHPEFRSIVLGYTAASPRHGGSGALYVRLRRARES